MENLKGIGNAGFPSEDAALPVISRLVIEESERLRVYRSWPNLPPRIQQAVVLLVSDYDEETE